MIPRFVFIAVLLLSWPGISEEGNAGAPWIAPGGVRDAAVLRAEAAPGILISIFGDNLAPSEVIVSERPLPTSVAGVSVETMAADVMRPAPLLFLSSRQINAEVPYGVEGESIDIRVRGPLGVSARERVTLLRSAPRVFAVVDETSTVVTKERPVRPGQILTAYFTGLGELIEDGLAGSLVRARMGDAPSDVLYVGRPEGSLLDQINFRVPAEASEGELPLEFSVGEARWEPVAALKVAGRTAPAPKTFHVSPRAGTAGDGSERNPWNIAHALSHPAGLSPGDTIVLHGGVYSGYFTSRITGTPEAPIVVRAASGERVTIDSGSIGHDALTVNGSHAWYMEFEVTSSDPIRSTPNTGSFPGDIKRGSCITSNGPNNRYINLVLHDCSQGVSFWTPSVDSELYGNLIYYNGWDGGDRGHGHGVYTQNADGVKRISENIIFDQFGLGIQAYGSNHASVRGYDLTGNVLFNNGSLSKGGLVDNILFAGGGTTKAHIRLEGNHVYHTPELNVGISRLGWQWDSINKDVVAIDNHWIGGAPALQICYWDSVVFQGNVMYSKGTVLAALSSQSQTWAKYQWNRNVYHGSPSFSIGGRSYTWAEWKATSRVDQASRYTNSPPSGTWIFVRSNRYQRGRANIVVYNWDRKSTVDVNISSILTSGSRFEIRDAQNFFGAPVVTGVFDGSPVRLPMEGLKAADPAGTTPMPPKHTAPEFSVFVLLPTR